MKSRRSGFTLIEILIVVAIIGVLLGFLGSALSSYLRTSKELATKQFLKSIELAIESYNTDYGHYPYYESATWVDGDLDDVKTQNKMLYKLLIGDSSENSYNYLQEALSKNSDNVIEDAGDKMIVDRNGNPLIYLFDTALLPKVAPEGDIANEEMWTKGKAAKEWMLMQRPTNAPKALMGMENRFELWSMGQDGEFDNLTIDEDGSDDPDRDNLIATETADMKRVGQ